MTLVDSPSDRVIDQESPPEKNPAGFLEMVVIAIALAWVMFTAIIVNKPALLFDGPFELDERLTDLIVRDPSLMHSLHAVQHGVDTNPPVFHLIDRALWTLFHSAFHNSPRVTLRAVSVICIWLSLVGGYYLLRAGFSRLAAFTAMLAVWATPEVTEQLVSARFYAPLLLATVLMCLALQIKRSSVLRSILVALAAILLCTLHYFGILILGPISLATMAIDRGTIASRFVRVLPVVAGPLALLPFLPLIHTQSAGFTVKTWIDPFSFPSARNFLQQILCPLPLIIVVAVWAISRLLGGASVPLTPADRETRRFASIPMLSLLVVPLVIVAFSATVQSALVTRYAISSSLVLAPIVALMVQNRSKWICFANIAMLSIFTLLEFRMIAGRHLGAVRLLAGQRDELVKENPPLPMIFADRFAAIRLEAFAPEVLPRISIIDQRNTGVALKDFRRFELTMSEKVAAFYPQPKMIKPTDLKDVGPFHVIAEPDDMQNLLLEMPMHHVTGDVFEISK